MWEGLILDSCIACMVILKKEYESFFFLLSVINYIFRIPQLQIFKSPFPRGSFCPHSKGIFQPYLATNPVCFCTYTRLHVYKTSERTNGFSGYGVWLWPGKRQTFDARKASFDRSSLFHAMTISPSEQLQPLYEQLAKRTIRRLRRRLNNHYQGVEITLMREVRGRFVHNFFQNTWTINLEKT